MPKKTRSSRRELFLYMPNGGADGVIRVWYPGDRRWIEFRGPPYSQWEPDGASPMQRIHDALEGRHATVLHQDEILLLHDGHPDFERVLQLARKAEES
jgi:hypothetical protein